MAMEQGGREGGRVGAQATSFSGVHAVEEVTRRAPTTGERAESWDGVGVRIASGVARRYRAIAVGQAITDALSLICALLVSYFIRYGLSPIRLDYLAVVVVLPVVWIGIFRAFALYSPQLLSAWEEFRRTISAASIGMVALVMASFWSMASLSRVWVGLTWLLVLVFQLATRKAWRARVTQMKADGSLVMRTLVIGSDGGHGKLVQTLNAPGSGYVPVGCVSTSQHGPSSDLQVVGDLDQLGDAIDTFGIDCLFVANGCLSEEEMMMVARTARRNELEIRVAANLPEIMSPRLCVQPMDGLMSFGVRLVRLSGAQARTKRIFDIVVSGLGFLFVLPILAVIAVGIKLTSKGPVLFRQARVTRGGHSFTMYKFRTMRNDADQILAEGNIDVTAPFFKLGTDDPRLTGFGRILRRLSLDELPQLLNVLKGEMSLVGPRPLPEDQVSRNAEFLGPRHEVPAGVSGWWQINGRSGVEDPREALRMDLFYIENWSLGLDLYILARTLGVLVSRKGAF